MSISEQRGLLYHAAEAYRTRGWSVIPLRGAADPAQPKAAAVPWSDFQRRHATPAELRKWFVDSSYQGIGVVCGPISHLAVMDFDDESAYHDFRATYPDLAAQHIIQTPRGHHIYYHIPANLGLPSAHFTGGDWLWSGRYVVARPTPGYKLIRGGEPKTLDQRDLHHIAAFIKSRKTQAEPPVSTSEPVVAQSYFPVGRYTLTTQYQYLAPQIGRNEALFRVSCKARDHGWSVDDTITALADLHVQQPNRHDHTLENPRHRHKEAVATIISAFSRPARPVQHGKSRGLPVSVVESLFALGLTCVVRVINALTERGVEAGEPISYTQMRRLLAGSGVGDWSIRKTLAAHLPDGAPVFPPSGHPQAPVGAASEKLQTDHQNNAYLVGRQNQQKGQHHRPQTFVIVPSATELSQRLGVTTTRPDPMTTSDLATASGTRLATMRELIARRPGQYPQQWQARRLGVSQRTVQRYQHLIKGLQITPVFMEIRLHWGNLAVLPNEIDIKGAFLEDETGKKYPPLRPLAAKLLAKGRAVSYKRQDANDYRLNYAPEATVAKPPQTGAAIPLRLTTSDKAYPTPPSSPTTLPDKADRSVQLPLSPLPPAQTPPAKGTTKRQYKRALTDPQQEALAQRVYTILNQMTENTADRLSLVSARRYVATYGPPLVERALKLLTRRHNLTKPAGFFATVLRSEAKSGRS